MKSKTGWWSLKDKRTIMQRDKGERNVVSIWLRGHPHCFVMPDFLAGSDYSRWTCIILLTDPNPPTSGDKWWQQVHDTSDFIYRTLLTLPNRRTKHMTNNVCWLTKNNFENVRGQKTGKHTKASLFTCRSLLALWKRWWEQLKLCIMCGMTVFRPDMPDRWTYQIRHIDMYQTRWDSF